jgi:hypothetical protein
VPAPPKTSARQFLDSLVPLAHFEPVTEISPVSRYICSQHQRIGSRCGVFEFLGRTEREFYSIRHGRIRRSVVDRNIHFQKHLSRARFRIDTSAELRDLIRPNTRPEFLPPTSEELIRLRAASEEYDRRVRTTQGRTAAIRVQYDAGRHSHPEEFQFRPTPKQTKEWENKLRESITKEYDREFREADVMMHRYISDLKRERDTAARERQVEIDEHVLHMMRMLPFHPAKPRYVGEINLLEDEIPVTYGFKTTNEWTEEVDVFEQIVSNYLPTRTKTRARETLETIQRTWFGDTQARLARFNKQKHDREAIRRSADFKKLLGATLVLNEDMTAAQAGQLMREPATAIEKRAHRLWNALHPEEMKQVA